MIWFVSSTNLRTFYCVHFPLDRTTVSQWRDVSILFKLETLFSPERDSEVPFKGQTCLFCFVDFLTPRIQIFPEEPFVNSQQNFKFLQRIWRALLFMSQGLFIKTRVVSREEQKILLSNFRACFGQFHSLTRPLLYASRLLGFVWY